MTKLIHDAEMMGYNDMRNNCQTIVSEIMTLFCRKFEKSISKEIDKELFVKEFLHFPAYFNMKFKGIGPFELSYRLSYFETYVDKDTTSVLQPKSFNNITEVVNKYKDRKDVKRFLQIMDENYLMHSKIRVSINNDGTYVAPKIPYPELSFPLDDEYGKISCLITIIHNELFRLKREIKLAKYCASWLKDYEVEIDLAETNAAAKKKLLSKYNKKEIKTRKQMAESLNALYKEKYKNLTYYRELNYYYYNNVRVELRNIKGKDNLSFIGFLLCKKAESFPLIIEREKKVEEMNQNIKN
eukprot:CAMPEP_0114592548 /NCGR_PEP_ID=MMETSP0125-20121206/14347_1 /TAXON_ID=485358 ORGANISM="Aristerostoma sp., Strain ATCC 50986" /NCGR_SAMPLE_ID=MMETSP0125 /ASSEMBLY_ACC=CAM_ASM_000245 /LENGTH=297 /DNA_ID=CAMNT_0001791247 /DNA_START=185 /DNA_END=1078 /DNA_ORIENTATION=-